MASRGKTDGLWVEIEQATDEIVRALGRDTVMRNRLVRKVSKIERHDHVRSRPNRCG